MDNIREPAYIIGNGPSRTPIDLTSLEGTTWGCNALYRDFAPDFLFSCDKGMITEIYNSGYCEHNKCYFRIHRGNKPAIKLPHPNIKIFTEQLSRPNNSGVCALHHAIAHGHQHIVLLGLDMRSKKDLTNIYAGTPNYVNQNAKPPKIRRPIPTKISEYIEKNPHINFYRIIDDNCLYPGNENAYEEWFKGLEGLQNIPHIQVEDFIKWLKIM